MKSAYTCHRMIKSAAQEMAGIFYENEASMNDVFYHHYPNQGFFIQREWGRFVPAARATLAKMLTMNYSETIKEEIMEALLLDRSLPQSQQKPH
jgi:hypothetical protein